MKKASKFLSFALRHNPTDAGITLDANGWAKTSEVLAALRSNVGPFNHEQLRELVETNDKKRFAFNERGDRIRASQGHSITVDLGLVARTPPPILFHGTKSQFLDSIFETGLNPMSRQHVHLSPTRETAQIVAKRRMGASIMLVIDTLKVEGDFFQSDNGVWLTDHVPVEAISIDSGAQ